MSSCPWVSEVHGHPDGQLTYLNECAPIIIVRELAPPGEFVSQQSLSFDFSNVEMQYESYHGMQVRLRYMLRVSVVRGLGQSVVKDFPFCVRNFEAAPADTGPQLKVRAYILCARCVNPLYLRKVTQ
jgi:hypothetical protein